MRRLVLILGAVVLLLGAGCPKTTPQPEPGVKPPTVAEKQEATVKRLQSAIKQLKPTHVTALEKHAQKLLREEERQAKTRHWLLVAGIGLLLGGLASAAGRVLGTFSAATAWWSFALAWLGRQVRWRDIVFGLLAGAACIAGAIWIDAAWGYMVDLGRLVLLSACVFVEWELAARYYTGEWDTPGDGVKPGRR